ncbi:hypothetical protein [Ferruginibacter sp.]|nr:hypothetical protein [Ferruginibacter sp.]
MNKKFSIIFIVFAILFGCFMTTCDTKQTASSIFTENTNKSDTSIISKNILTDSAERKKRLYSLIAEIDSLKLLKSNYFNKEDEMPKYPRYDSLLMRLATIAELEELTNNKSPKIRVCSFNALLLTDVNFEVVQTIFQKHLKDKEAFLHWSGGCITTVLVNAYFLDRISTKFSATQRLHFEKIMTTTESGERL